jgi:hypothetical protein
VAVRLSSGSAAASDASGYNRAYRAVEYIKKNMKLDKAEADIEDSKTVVSHLHGIRSVRHVEHLHLRDGTNAGFCVLQS